MIYLNQFTNVASLSLHVFCEFEFRLNKVIMVSTYFKVLRLNSKNVKMLKNPHKFKSISFISAKPVIS